MSQPRAAVPPELNATIESLWGELRAHLEWAGGFSLVFLFVADESTATALRERLDSVLRYQSRALQHVTSEFADSLTGDVLRALFEPHSGYRAMRAPAWIEAHRYPLDDAWNGARNNLLARLNERRGALESEFARALLVLLPRAFRPAVRSIAPDLWHIRRYSGEVAAARSVSTITERASEQRAAVRVAPTSPGGSLDLVDEWDRLRGAADKSRLSLDLGIAAVQQSLVSGRLDFAARVADEVVRIAEQRARSAPDSPNGAAAWRSLALARGMAGDTAKSSGALEDAERHYRQCLEADREVERLGGESPDLSRRRSVTLERIGDVARALGRLEEAEKGYRETLDLGLRLMKSVGETPEIVRDVSVSWNKMGDVARALGRLEEAEKAYRESLDLRLRLMKSVGETPEIVRDVSVSWERMGDIARALGRLEEAEKAYRESLDLRLRLMKSVGETPEIVRDFSVSWGKMGDIARALGRLEEAEKAYRESLDLGLRLMKSVGETPETVRDVSVSWNKVGDIARALGRLEEAEKAYRESLDLGLRIMKSVRETPEIARNVSVSWERLGDIARALGRLEEAEKAYRESLDLRLRLMKSVGETPQVLHDLTMSYAKLGELARDRGTLSDAESVFAEARRLAANLCDRAPSNTDYRNLADQLERDLGALREKIGAARSTMANPE